MAGQFADSVNAELLVVTHHKASIMEKDQIRAREAREAITGGTRVLSATDFMEVAIPRKGFKFLKQQGSDKSSIQQSGSQGALLPRFDSDEAAISKVSNDFGSSKCFDFSKKL